MLGHHLSPHCWVSGLSSLGLGFTVWSVWYGGSLNSESVVHCVLAPGPRLGGNNIQVPVSFSAELRSIPCSPLNHPNLLEG